MTTQPQHQPRYWVAILVLLALGGGAVMLYRFDPAQHGFYPVCLFHRVTGLQCPGCGAQRALYQLAHGHVLAALHFNPLLIVTLPFLVFTGARMVVSEIAGKPMAAIPMRAFWLRLIIGAIIAFTILRNIPIAPFTYLSPPP
jgi:Protein of unknown function (DUF2752)